MVKGKHANLVDSASVGYDPQLFSEVQTIRFVIHDFKNCKEKVNQSLISPILKAHGFQWKIQVYPRGIVETDDPNSRHLSCLLHSANKKDAIVKFTIRISDVVLSYSTHFQYGQSLGWDDVVPRKDILESGLEQDGGLVIEFDIQVPVERKAIWYPKLLQRQDILCQLYNDADSKTADAVFDIGGMQYRAHKNILSLRAETLFELVEDYSSDTPIKIHDISQANFKALLDYAYTIRKPEIENEAKAMEILSAANRFQCTGLKLYAESMIVENFLTTENAARLFVRADSSSLALLKEAALKLIVINLAAVRGSGDWSKVQECPRLLRELLDWIATGCLVTSKFNVKSTSTEVDQLDVTSLRERLGKASLEVDGSRELLVKRLKERAL